MWVYVRITIKAAHLSTNDPTFAISAPPMPVSSLPSLPSVVAHNGTFQKYYIRKLAEGKERRLVLNNVANKLIKIACAVIKNNLRYVSTYRSVNPMCLISA